MSPSRAVATTTGTAGRCGPAFPDGASVVAACRDVAWSRYAPATSAVSTSSHGHQRRCPGGGAIRPGPASGATDLGSRGLGSDGTARVHVPLPLLALPQDARRRIRDLPHVSRGRIPSGAGPGADRALRVLAWLLPAVLWALRVRRPRWSTLARAGRGAG